MAKLDDLPKLRATLFVNVMFISLANIVILGLVGALIDYNFNVKSVGILVGIVASFPITIFLVIKRAKKLI